MTSPELARRVRFTYLDGEPHVDLDFEGWIRAIMIVHYNVLPDDLVLLEIIALAPRYGVRFHIVALVSIVRSSRGLLSLN